jgi:hypothetical protein
VFFTTFGISTKPVRLIKMYLNEMQSTVRVGTHFSDKFPTKNSVNQGDALSPLLLNCALEYATRKVQANQEGQKVNEKRPLGRPRRRREDSIKMNLQEEGCEGMDWIAWLWIGTGGRLVNAVMNLRVP